MSKTTNTPTYEPSEGLRDKVQSFRDKAREILRAKMIATRLQAIFDISKSTKSYDEALIARNKSLARALYALSKLEKENPDYEEIKKNNDEWIATETENVNSATKNAEEAKKKMNDRINELNSEISDIEAGKMKVNIDEVAALTTKLIDEEM